ETAGSESKTNAAMNRPEGRTNMEARAGGEGRPRGERRGGGGEGRGPRGMGGPGGPGGGRLGMPSERFSQRTVYVLDNAGSATPTLKPVQIKTGITDGVNTEVLEGLAEGDQIVTSMISSDPSADSSRPSNPFGGGGFPRRF
ncbi:MAG TPA: hypothetical protein VK327_16860, partial [Candidatus Paceibacterota bacterium]|nr:hypothetical protein [Candidatus Paceibacterota bacterium]